MLRGGHRLKAQPGRRFNLLSHLIMVAPAMAGSIWLLMLSDRPIEYVATSIYGLMLIQLFVASSLHHGLSHRTEHNRWQKLDHISIYLMIAGSYTPFCLLALQGAWGWSLLGIIWGLAAVGLLLDALHREGDERHKQLLLYLAMGWLILIAIRPLNHALSHGEMIWLVTGGLLYSAGVFFFVQDERWPWAHGAWHMFVIAGAASHYIAISMLL
ncbi:MAG: hemolysin III family protein [Zetaproteobacteria bacterium]|nr:MAG: hemolysin III family protein [Zetaproteobacteria bacterium]